MDTPQNKTIKEMARRFLDAVRRGGYAAALTGAGVSTASGIPDFRGVNGLYSKISQEIFELDFLLSRPQDYYRIAIEHIHPLADKEPNVTHRMLAELERQGLLDIIITQNIDGLHQKAGSDNVVEFHGDVTRFFCMRCDKPYPRPWVDAQIRASGTPTCTCGGLVRPGIVFFGDMIPLEALMAAQMAAEEAEVFVVMGTSLQVHPASGIASLALRSGARLHIINRDPTGLDGLAEGVYAEDLSVFSEAVLGLL